MRDIKINIRILLAFIPTALIGFFLYGFIKEALFENALVSIVALGGGGILIILFELFQKNPAESDREIEVISYPKAFIIGCAQALAVIPGVSRAAATIIGGMLIGIKRRTIVELSYLRAVPTIGAGAGYDLLKTAPVFSGEEVIYLIIGFFAALISALISIRLFTRYIERHSFIGFGVYRIALAFILYIALL